MNIYTIATTRLRYKDLYIRVYILDLVIIAIDSEVLISFSLFSDVKAGHIILY